MKKILSTTLCSFALLVLSSSYSAAQALSAAISSVTNVYCNGGNTGTATVQASGGTAPYTYSWSPSGGLAPTATNLPAGNYTVTVSDGVGAVVNAYTAVTQPAPITGTSTHTDVTCNGSCNGTANAVFTGGTAAFTYSWSPMGGTAPVMNNLCQGTYTCTTTDSHGCSGSQVITITQVSPVVNTVTHTDASCLSGCNGTANISTSGGTAPYTYSWMAPQPAQTTVPNVTGLCSGNYTCSVTDANNCQSVVGLYIGQQADFTLATSTTLSTCAGTTGTATVTITGGTGPFTYSWGPAGSIPTGQGTPTVTNLGAGTYTVTVTEASGCTQTAVATVSNTGAPAATVTTSTNASCTVCNGSATLSINGGTAPYTYQWFPNGGAGLTANGLCAGAYTFQVTDANGCISSTPVTIAQPTQMQTVLQTTNVICTTNGSAMATVTGGTPPYTYSWSPAVPAGQGSGNATGLPQGTYTLYVTDAQGCTSLATTSIYNVYNLTLTTNVFHVRCKGASNGSVVAFPYGGTAPYLYSWNTGATTDSLLNQGSGTYQVSVVDANGCTANASATILSPGNLYIALNSTPTNCGHNGTASVLSAQGGSGAYSYSWNTVPPQTTAMATGLAGGTYSVTVTDSGGCQAQGTVAVLTQGCKSVIRGRVFHDVNGNCLQDAGENGIPNLTLYLPSLSAVGFTDVNGDYTILTDSLSNTVSVILPYGYSASCQGTNIPANVLAAGDTSLNNNFALSAPSGFDLAIHPGWFTSRPGFPKEYWIYYWNQGFTPQNGIITFKYDSNLVYNSCTGSGVVDTATHTIHWTVNSLQPGYYGFISPTQEFHAYFTVPAALTLGSNIHSHFQIDPSTGDLDPSNNVLDDDSPVTGSHDPNSKSVMPAGIGTQGNITPKDSVLFYTINFQNSGTDTAFTVVVKDTLSPYLDPLSIKPGASNHPFTFSMDGKGILTWRFDRILLPDSTVSPAGSCGSFNYSVKLKKGIPYGSVIRNTAYVYFDFNSPVVTNTTVNTLTSPLFVNEFAKNTENISAYPNPFDENTHIRLRGQNTERVFVLYDVVGRELRRFVSSENEVIINRETLMTGVYVLKIYSGNELAGEHKLVVR